MAQVGKIGGIAGGEQAAAFHRREHSAEPLTIAAGVADLHDTRNLTVSITLSQIDEVYIIHHALAFVVTVLLLGRLSRKAASAPAMRPKTPPMVMPIPAR